jgi:hypothetical protein
MIKRLTMTPELRRPGAELEMLVVARRNHLPGLCRPEIADRMARNRIGGPVPGSALTWRLGGNSSRRAVTCEAESPVKALGGAFPPSPISFTRGLK